MDRFKVWLAEGLILVPTVLLFALLLFTLAFRLGRLSNMAELLPANTEAFFVINMDDFNASGAPVKNIYLNEFLTIPFKELSWFKRDFGMALIDGSVVEIFQVKSKEEAEGFFSGLVEGENLATSEKDPQVNCFKAQAMCYRLDGNFLSFSSSEDALLTIGESTPRLEDNENYQNIRSRVGHFQSGFAYIDIQAAKEHFSTSLILTNALEIFPAWGASIKMEPGGWYMESFTSVNKNLLGSAYFHPTQKYGQNFLPWTEPFGMEWGGEDLAAQVQRMKEIFAQLGPSSELVFNSSLHAYLKQFFGEVTWEQLSPVLDGESYFGWTSAEDFLFIFECKNEEEKKIAETLQQNFMSHFYYKKTYTNDKNETKVEQIPLTSEARRSGENQYIILKAGDQTVAAVAYTTSALFIASTEENLISALARQSGQETERNSGDFSTLLPGSDEIWILDSAFLPETNILKTNLSTLTRLMSTRKLFDDGIFTRTSLLPSTSAVNAY